MINLLAQSIVTESNWAFMAAMCVISGQWFELRYRVGQLERKIDSKTTTRKKDDSDA